MTTPFHVTPIVEGHGETAAVPLLLRRLVPLIDPSRTAEVSKPIRQHRSLLLKAGQLERFVDLAARRVRERHGAVLVLVDCDQSCAARLGPELLSRVLDAVGDTPAAVVLPVREFEAWFLAAAASIAGRRGLPPELDPPAHPEGVVDAKGWLTRRRTDGLAYSPTTDQPALANAFDLRAARSRSPSFDKLWRELQRLLDETAHRGSRS